MPHLWTRSSFAAAALTALAVPGPALAQDTVEAQGLTIEFADAAWTGEQIPEGQQCALHGGSGATPALEVGRVPGETHSITVAFNDETYKPMDDGGHGIIEYDVSADADDGMVTLQSVPGGTANLPDGVSVYEASRGTGDYASPGYLPPCSGGEGNTYTATVTARDSSGSELVSADITLGTY